MGLTSATAHPANSPSLRASVSAPAKLNLTLEVLGRRDDGFHEMRSLVVGAGLTDQLSAGLRSERDFSIECAEASLATADNLVIRALHAFRDVLPAVPGGLHVHLRKQIPVGGGLGGGSSDAAAALRLANALWGVGWPDEKLARVGVGIGSDVPLFFHLPAAVVSGRGVDVEPVRLTWSGHALLVFAGVPVPTAAVYKAWRPADGAGRPGGTEEGIACAGGAAEIMPLLSNHLEPAIARVAPQVGELAGALERALPGPWRISGAGSTLFRLFDAFDEARDVQQHLARAGPGAETAIVAVPVPADPVSFEEA